MTVTVYRSTDAGAPALNGLVGSLITVLDAVLVNGYGSKPAAGWTKPFSGTNKAVYRNSDTLGTGTYFRVRDDAAAPVTSAQNAVVRGYETMSDIDTGVGAFPTLSQTAETSNETNQIYKSNASSAAARSWLIVADEKSAWIITNAFGVVQNVGYPFFLGDIKSYMANDPYCAVNGGWRPTGGATPQYTIAGAMSVTLINTQSASGVPKIRRDHLGSVVSSAYDAYIKMAHPSATLWGQSGFPYPYQVSNSLTYQKPIIVCAGVVRGEYPAILIPLHNRPLVAGDTIEIEGKTYLVIDMPTSTETSLTGQFFINLTGPW